MAAPACTVGNADNFNYLYQPLNGDGQIVAQVATQDNTDASAQAGIMIRETLDATSKHAAMLITPNNGILFEQRLATSGGTSLTIFSGVAAPYWHFGYCRDFLNSGRLHAASDGE